MVIVLILKKNKMKKKLLITMGCSHTEGVGCWDYTTFSSSLKKGLDNYTDIFLKKGAPPYWNTLNDGFDEFLWTRNRGNFLRGGWPINLTKSLKLDNLINLGRGGSSNSGQVKTFFEKGIHDMKFSDYDVTLIWLMTEPFRISYYSGSVVRDYSNINDNIYSSYVEEILKQEENKRARGIWEIFDPHLESMFYFKIMEFVCEKNEWNFIALSSDHSEFLDMVYENKDKWKQNRGFKYYDNYRSDNFINNKLFPDDIKLRSPFCGHLNSEGYQILSKRIENILLDRFPDFIGTNQNRPTTLYLGDVQELETNWKYKFL